jgi:leukotriene-A4 hydrolase
MTTAGFLADLREHLIAPPPKFQGEDAQRARVESRALEEKLRIDEWVFQPGLPSNATQPVSDAFAQVDTQIQAYVNGAYVHTLKVDGWVTQQWQHFLNNMPKTVTDEQVAALDKGFGFSRQGNSEVLFSWLRIAIRHHFTPAMPALEHFLTSQGRRKFLKPLYEDLMATDWGKAEARRIYKRARPLYHAVATTTLDGIVK